jgi:hypothetical protein
MSALKMSHVEIDRISRPQGHMLKKNVAREAVRRPDPNRTG